MTEPITQEFNDYIFDQLRDLPMHERLGHSGIAIPVRDLDPQYPHTLAKRMVSLLKLKPYSYSPLARAALQWYAGHVAVDPRLSDTASEVLTGWEHRADD